MKFAFIYQKLQNISYVKTKFSGGFTSQMNK